MKTTEQFYQELNSDPSNASMTRLVNGETVVLSSEERESTLREWAEAQFKNQAKVWPNVQEFMGDFTMPEKGAIALSMDPTIAALRLELTTWLSEVHADDPRVVAGINRVVELGIITPERKNTILSL